MRDLRNAPALLIKLNVILNQQVSSLHFSKYIQKLPNCSQTLGQIKACTAVTSVVNTRQPVQRGMSVFKSSNSKQVLSATKLWVRSILTSWFFMFQVFLYLEYASLLLKELNYIHLPSIHQSTCSYLQGLDPHRPVCMQT